MQNKQGRSIACVALQGIEQLLELVQAGLTRLLVVLVLVVVFIVVLKGARLPRPKCEELYENEYEFIRTSDTSVQSSSRPGSVARSGCSATDSIMQVCGHAKQSRRQTHEPDAPGKAESAGMDWNTMSEENSFSVRISCFRVARWRPVRACTSASVVRSPVMELNSSTVLIVETSRCGVLK